MTRDLKQVAAQMGETDASVSRLELLDTLFAVSGIGTWQVNLPQKTVEWDSQTRKIFGVDDSFHPELDHLSCFFPGKAGTLMRQTLEKAFEDGTGWDLELPFLDQSGKRMWVQSFARPRMSDGQVVQIIGGIKDISSRKMAAQRILRSEAPLRTTLASLADGVVSFDQHGVVRSCNAAFWKLNDVAVEDLIGRKHDTLPLQFIDEKFADIPLEESPLNTAVLHGESLNGLSCRIRCRTTGEVRFMEMTAQAALDKDTGRNLGVVVTFRDVTKAFHQADELAASEQAARKTLEELRAVFASMRHAVAIFDKNTCLLHWNQRFEKVFIRTSLQAVEGLTYRQIVDEVISVYQMSEETKQGLLEMQAKVTEGKFGEIEYKTSDNRNIAATFSPLPEGGWITTLQDITSEKEASDKILHAALHDQLTRLGNRTKFNQEVDRIIELDAEERNNYALMMIDLDHFKYVNDTFGHGIGDKLLQEVAERIRNCLRPGDMPVRLGGDEFAVLISAEKDRRATFSMVASRLVSELSTPYQIDGKRLEVGASIGVAPFITLSDAPTKVVGAADQALYKVKSDGRNDFRFYDSTIRSQAQKRQSMEADLVNALPNGELEIYYKPVADLKTNEVIGLQTQLMWNRPGIGLLDSNEFQNLAEETGIISSIGEWAVEKILEEAVGWPEGKRVGLQISARQLGSGTFAQMVLDLLNRTKFPPDHLRVEVREDVILNSSDAFMDELFQLKMMGCKIALDHFGSGVASLHTLQRFNFGAVKISGDLIESIYENSTQATVVTAIANIAKSMNMGVQAENVTTSDQCYLARIVGCTHAAGSYFGRPMLASEINWNPIKQEKQHSPPAVA